MRLFVLPILVGIITGVLTLWAFESFSSQPTSFFVNAAIKSAVVVIAVTFVLYLMRARKK